MYFYKRLNSENAQGLHLFHAAPDYDFLLKRMQIQSDVY